MTKPRYPALEIAYLAVDKNYHKSGLGKIIVEAIVQKAQKQDLAGCQFITVEALNTQEYNAVGFMISVVSRLANIRIQIRVH